MKVLVTYDGSRCSEAALDDLVRAGLQESGEARAISVAEIWLSPPNWHNRVARIQLDAVLENLKERRSEKNKGLVDEADTLARHAKKRMQAMFPRWRVTSEATYGSPAWEILARADEFNSDLIVVGSHGRSEISRFFLGSIAQKILNDAHCSVRVARGHIEVDSTPARIVIGFDGSKGAHAAVNTVASRSWRAKSEVRLIVATSGVNPSSVDRFFPPTIRSGEDINLLDREWIETLAQNALRELRSANISTDLQLHAGNPKNILVDEAAKWDADCIFVGANAFGSRLERSILGSTSAAVAARAHCSVEVVRV